MSNQQPSCFGKLWSASAPECRGGNDPSYINQATGTNRREACRWYGQCAETKNNQQVPQNRQGVIPPQALTANRPPPQPVMPSPVPIPNTYMMQAPPPPQPVYAQQMPQQPQQASPYVHPPQAAQPMMVPVNQPMTGAATQSFLMVPEPVNGGTYGQRMFRTIFRSMAKAGALAVANHMDYSPMVPYE